MTSEQTGPMGAKWVDMPCRVCGRLLGDHGLSTLQICYYFKELAKYDPTTELGP